MGVTQYTRVWRPTSKVFLNKIVDHKITKFASDVKNIMRKTIAHSKCPGIIDAVEAAATGLFRTASG